MKIYLAGTVGIREREETLLRLYDKRLVSFHYIKEELMYQKESFQMWAKQNENLSCCN